MSDRLGGPESRVVDRENLAGKSCKRFPGSRHHYLLFGRSVELIVQPDAKDVEVGMAAPV
jgi:hypothetical protein